MYALITGAAQGIGKAIADQLGKRNFNLLLIDMDEDKLKTTVSELATKYSVEVLYLVQDLSEVGFHTKIFEWSKPLHGNLQVFVNNAGYGLHGAFEKLPLEQQINMLQVNILSMVTLTSLFIPILKKINTSYLLNVSSTTAYQAIPYLTTYAASKAFVLSFTRGLQYELKDSNLSVSCLCPGSTDTNFVNRAGMNDRIKKKAKQFNMTPEQVANYSVDRLFRKRIEIIPGFLNQLNSFVPRFLPKRFIEKFAGKLYSP